MNLKRLEQSVKELELKTDKLINRFNILEHLSNELLNKLNEMECNNE